MDFLCLLTKELIKGNIILRISFLSSKILSVFLFILIFTGQSQAESFDSVIMELSVKYGLSEIMIYNLIEAESSFNSRAVSPCDARGLMQITKRTWDWICSDYLEVEWDFNDCAFDSEKNIRVGMRFLKWISDYLDRYENRLNDSKDRLLLACYNAGPGAVKNSGFRVPPFEETHNYVAKITAAFLPKS
ncbi:MAG: lytic transglycosylase domain-containing protein [Candidatus Omnitrophica bacterium]|nr:lytic transglycosylase domain-containing protein [Candidatus Omnitrophota bacterium]